MRRAGTNFSGSPPVRVEHRDAQPSLPDAQARLVARCTALYRASEPGLLEGVDPEAVHQARVALRQITAVLGLFKEKPASPARRQLRAEIRWLARALGGVRDWEVFRFETLSGIPPDLLDPTRRRAFDEAAAVRITQARRQLRRVLLSRRYRNLHALLDEWGALPAETGADSTACTFDLTASSSVEEPDHALARRQRQLLRLGRRLSQADDQRLHDVRLAAKHLRYSIDFLAATHEQAHIETADRTLKRLQEALGQFNDIVVAQERLRDMAAVPMTSAHAPIRSRELEDHLERERCERREVVLDRWKQWRKTLQGERRETPRAPPPARR
jgi:CHAD domain-containing protein